MSGHRFALALLTLLLVGCPNPDFSGGEREGELGNLLFIDNLGVDADGPILLGATFELTVPSERFGPLVPQSTDEAVLTVLEAETCGRFVDLEAKRSEEQVDAPFLDASDSCDAVITLLASGEGEAHIELIDRDYALVDRIPFEVRQADAAVFSSASLPSWAGVPEGGELLASSRRDVSVDVRLTGDGDVLRHREALPLTVDGAERIGTAMGHGKLMVTVTMQGENQEVSVGTPVGDLRFAADLVAVTNSEVTDVRIRVDEVTKSEPWRCFGLVGYARRDGVPVLDAELSWSAGLPFVLSTGSPDHASACESLGAFDFVKLQGQWTGGPAHVRYLDARPGSSPVPDSAVGVNEPTIPGRGCSVATPGGSWLALLLLLALRRRS